MTDRNESDQLTPVEQFADGETIVECHASGCAGTGKTTRLIEWFREQHDDEAVLRLFDPKGDPSPPTIDVLEINPFGIDPQPTTYKYSASIKWKDSTADEEGAP
jgi:hypothetical protein